MTLGVDRSFPETCSQMEHKSRGGWRTRIPESVRSVRPHPRTQRTDEGLRDTADQETKEKSMNKKTVTMAPTSRYITSRSLYIPRKPLVAMEHQASILKNPLAHEYSEKELQLQVEDRGSSACRRKEKSSSLKPSDKDLMPNSRTEASSPSASREDLTIPMSISDLRLGPSFEEPVLRTSSPVCSLTRSLSSPPLDLQTFTVPLSTTWTSTQELHPLHSYTPPACVSGRTRAQGRVSESSRSTGLSLGSSKSHAPSLQKMSPYQANYWACAIPKALPPSPDRRSPNWDPDKEYEALLDYTYPLRANAGNAWCPAEPGSLVRTDPLLLDSGIGLDRYYSSSSLSGLDQSFTSTGRGKDRHWTDQGSYESRGLEPREPSHAKSSDGCLSSSLLSSLDRLGLSLESLDSEGRPSQLSSHYRKLGIFSSFRSAPTFIPSSRLLPRIGPQGEWDEEFLRLPDQLQELQVLSQQLRDITTQVVNRPATDSWESLDQEMTSVRFSPGQAERQHTEVSAGQGDEEVEEAHEEAHEEVHKEEDEEDGGSDALLQTTDSSQEIKEIYRRRQIFNTEVNRESLREVEAIMTRLSRGSSKEIQRRSPSEQADVDGKESLMHRIQEFCSNLAQLIQWLYSVVDRLEVLSPPTVNIDSVKASLADYKSFQKEVRAKQPLTASVLQTGEILLHCMDSTSPVLRDTLVLVEKQSRALETHSEHLFSSILSAMDSLTEPSQGQATGGSKSVNEEE